MSFRLSSAMSVSSKPNRSLSTARSLMYGQSVLMPSSRTLRSQPPKTGIQYPKRISRVSSSDNDLSEPSSAAADSASAAAGSASAAAGSASAAAGSASAAAGPAAAISR